MVGRLNAELFHDNQTAILRQETYDRGFPMLHWHDGDTNVDVSPPDPQPRGAILRKPALCDVEVGDDLDAGNDGLRQDAGPGRERPPPSGYAPIEHHTGLKRLA